MPLPVPNSLQINPRIVIELQPGLDPEHPQIQITHENMSQGYVTVAQILYAALGAILPHVFAQLMQQQPQDNRIVLASGLEKLHGDYDR